MQGARRQSRPGKAHHGWRMRIRFLLGLLVVALLGCFTFLLLSAPSCDPAGAEWDPRRNQADSEYNQNEARRVPRRDDWMRQEQLVALRVYAVWRTLRGAQEHFAALRSAFIADQLEVNLSILIQLGLDRMNKTTEELSDVERFVQQLEWPFGRLQVDTRGARFDTVGTLPFSWPADRDNELALFLDEGVLLDATDVRWLRQAGQAYGTAINDGRQLMGMHLQPAYHSGSFPPSVVPSGPFLVQAACSCGCVFLPGPWRQFQDYSRLRQGVEDSQFPPAPRSPPGGPHWQRHLFEMMHARGMLTLHPPLQETGHLLQDSGRPPDLPPVTALPMFDAALHRVPSVGRLLYSGLAWAVRPVLQSGDPARQALAQALYGYPGATQCLLEYWTETRQYEEQSGQWGKGGRRLGTYEKRGVSQKGTYGSGQPEGGPAERFLFFSPQFGLSNQLLAYADMAALATALNRTLVLAPLRHKDGTFIEVESLLDVGKLFHLHSWGPGRGGDQSDGEHGAESRGLSEGAEKVRAIAHMDFMERVMLGRPLPSLVRFDWSNRFGGREKDDAWLVQAGLLDAAVTQELLLPTLAMYRHTMRLLWGGCTAHRVLALDIGFLATAWRQEALGEDESEEGRRYDAVRRRLHAWVHRPFREELVEQVAAAVRPVGPFTCLHLRRGDFAGYCAMIRDQRRRDPAGPYGIPFFAPFTYRNCFPRLADLALLLNATSLVPPGHRLYVATNEADRDLLALHLGDAFDWLDLAGLAREAAGLPAHLPPVLLDRLVCQHAQALVGNRWSTFSRSIAQSGPAQIHYVGFGQLALLSRPEDDDDLQRLRSLLSAPRFDAWQRAATRGVHTVADKQSDAARESQLEALLDFRTPAPPRTCMQQPSDRLTEGQYWYRTEYFRGRLPRHSHDVTLVTHASSATLGLVRRLLRAWPGVVSLGYCLGPANASSQLAALRHLARESEEAGRARLDVALLTSSPPGAPAGQAWQPLHHSPGHVWVQGTAACPVLLLLELALDAALTDLVGVVDPGVQPSRGLYATWTQPRAYRFLREQALGEGDRKAPRWLAVPVLEADSQANVTATGHMAELAQEVSTAQLPPHYVLAARQHLPCLRHLAAAGDEAGTIGRQLTKSGIAAMLLTSGHFYRAGG